LPYPPGDKPEEFVILAKPPVVAKLLKKEVVNEVLGIQYDGWYRVVKYGVLGVLRVLVKGTHSP
jgi:hypothetical protein